MTRASSRWSEFRARGGLWVVAQIVLMGAVVIALRFPHGWPSSVPEPLRVVGLLLAVLGLTFAVWGFRSLGQSFTAYTTPPQAASRVESGPYRLVRHPMYGGGLIFFAGLSLAFTVTALVPTLLLGLLWRGKSAVEERNLVALFPEYASYRARTVHRFLPWIY
jgi:protein-S-isoprenylcysteine O-methyltransferase Ste14